MIGSDGPTTSLVILGAGATGLMAAISAAEEFRQTGAPASLILLEGGKEPGRKIVMSGGGRCNILPALSDASQFFSSSPERLVRRALDRFGLEDQKAFFEELLGGPLVAEGPKLFPPSNRAKDVRDRLVAKALALGVKIRTSQLALSVRREGHRFLIEVTPVPMTLIGSPMTIEADSVLLATGGRSVMPDLPGPAGFELATVLEHTVRPLFPALVPLVAESAPHRALSGISLEATISVVSGKERTSTSGGFLFTHRGYSGPAVLNVSHAVAQALDAGVAPRVSVAFGDEKTWEERLRGSSGTASALLKRYFPDRLADLFVQTSGIGVKPLQHLPRDDRRRLIATLTDFFLPVTGTEGFRAAEVTGGGVALEEVDPGSGESRLVPGLFLAGEILDVFGPIGGFNFQWAWATGRTAGRAAARAALNAEPLT